MQHIGFIMDGNRRWAKKLKNIASFGHEWGSIALERTIELCLDRHIPYVSFWALSRENILERSKLELTAIYMIMRHKLAHMVEVFLRRGIRFEIVGDRDLLPSDLRQRLDEAVEATKWGTAMTCIFALGYSGQDEIVRGVRAWMSSWKSLESLDEQSFFSTLDSGRFPPPDMIVRTGWNIRHSGYFLYASAYSEYYFTQTLWPDFSAQDLDKALEYYIWVQRNFWK